MVCRNINAGGGGKIRVRWVGCAQVRLRQHPCCPMGESGDATLEQKAPQDVSGESRRGWQEDPRLRSAAAQLGAWLSPNTSSSGGWC